MDAKPWNGDYDREHPSAGSGSSWDAIQRKAREAERRAAEAAGRCPVGCDCQRCMLPQPKDAA